MGPPCQEQMLINALRQLCYLWSELSSRTQILKIAKQCIDTLRSCSFIHAKALEHIAGFVNLSVAQVWSVCCNPTLASKNFLK